MSADHRDGALRVIAQVAGDLCFFGPVGPCEPLAAAEQEHAVEVGFSGAHRGTVIVGVTPGVAQLILQNMCMADPDAPVAEADRVEALKEFANVVTGNLLPVLFGFHDEHALQEPRPRALQDLGAGDAVAVGLELDEGRIAVRIELEGA